MDREPAAWETNTSMPFLRMGDVGVHGLGRDRFLVVAPDELGVTVEGFEHARQLARVLSGLPAIVG